MFCVCGGQYNVRRRDDADKEGVRADGQHGKTALIHPHKAGLVECSGVTHREYVKERLSGGGARSAGVGAEGDAGGLPS